MRSRSGVEVDASAQHELVATEAGTLKFDMSTTPTGPGGRFRGTAALDDLTKTLRSANEAYRGTARLGHALSKHAGRRQDLWGKLKGHPDTWHEQAMKQLRSIYDAPGEFRRITNAKGITFFEKWHNGRGIRLNLDWTWVLGLRGDHGAAGRVGVRGC